MQPEKKVGLLIQDIAEKRRSGGGMPVMSGEVVSVDADEMTAVVRLISDSDEAPTEGVNLNVVLENKKGVYMVPAVGAFCIVAEVDGEGKWEVLKASEYERVYMKGGGKFIDITDSVVLLNGDGKGGLAIVEEVAKRIKAVEEKVNKLNAAMKGIAVPLAPSGTYLFTADPNVLALTDITPLTSKSDIENSNVKHG